jgi:anion-transporting  ArsA/GET3 family ATPase
MAGLLDKRLLIVSGKGGVGKSTVAAALALSAARSGRRTLVCEVNADERVSHLLGHPEVGPEIRQLEENLWAVDVRPQEAMREYALMVLKFKTVYKAVFENRLVRYFLRFIPSLQELVMLGKILFHLQERRPDGAWRYDCIVMDAPATGHALSFLSVPQVLLDTVPPGAMASEARKMRDLLVDPAVTQAVLVSLPEEMPIVETLELAQGLREKVRVHTAAAVLNAFIPERFSADDVDALPPPLRPTAKAHLERAKLSVQSQERLERGLSVPVFPVPRLFVESFGRKAIEEVARHLRPLVEGGR